ncbi:MAG: DUF721 domain-containing protein [Ignavibacteriales bacterium]|nr:DUF721 domain-containing protein [Ignavibacteriales bacterium]
MAKRLQLHSKPLGSALQELVEGLGISKKLREYDAVTRWEEIVGAAIARVTRAEKITHGVLIVSVRTSTWRNELQLRKNDIITKLNSTLGNNVVKDIRFH